MGKIQEGEEDRDHDQERISEGSQEGVVAKGGCWGALNPIIHRLKSAVPLITADDRLGYLPLDA